MNTTEIIVSFKRNAKTGGKTRAVADFSKIEVDSVYAKAALSQAEEPLILCLLSQSHWTLLTTERLIYFAENKHSFVELSHIVGTSSDEPGMISFTGENRLKFELNTGGIFEIECEPGENSSALHLAAYQIYGDIQKNSIDPEANAAHKNGLHNKELLRQSETCGCYYCLDIFTFNQIVNWADREKDTAICPNCGIDSVIGSASGYPINRDFLNRMKVMWFSDN